MAYKDKITGDICPSEQEYKRYAEMVRKQTEREKKRNESNTNNTKS